ncbi:endonuclease/exonuclease/phosphatase family protein [Riemerella anatipestifer]|nr:endonuclease/exonuclease/phosphatase family protein [Riemerella anatipestifer]MDR7794390.1 endonuclease/exonuclease/phosphatase family protein [Riemerella anatipestifer]
MMKILRIIVFIIHLGFLALLYLCMMNAYIPPRVFAELNFLSLAFPILVLGYCLLCLFWILGWKKRGLFFLLALALLLTPIRRWVNYSTENKNDSDFKVVSFNIKAAEGGIANIDHHLESFSPDIILIQEKGDFKEEIESMPYRKEIDILEFYSKTPIIESGRILKDADNGYASYIDTEIKGKRIRFINVYLKPFELNKDMVKPSKNLRVTKEKTENLIERFLPVFKAHQTQVEQIRLAVEKSPYPVVLGGDFNAVPNSYEYYYLSQNMTDSFLEVGKGLGTTFHDYKFPIRIDYLFSIKGIKPVSLKTDRSRQLSDHYPIIGEFKY